LVTLYAKPKKTRIAGESLLQVGDDFGTALCLKPGADAVWSIDLKSELPTRFVNSNIPAMLAFISLHKKYSMKMDETASEDEFQKVADDLANEYNKLDAAALTNQENYWPVILEQTRDGLI
jgi:SUKH-4 immunity protein of toxin-antitoxin system